jgi:hypothetical protein
MSGQLYAVLVGNGTFEGDQSHLRNLRCPVRDVETLAEVLASDSHGAYVVTKAINSSHDAVRKAIYLSLRRATSEDLVLIYYSGHGKLDDGGNLYLATSDTDISALPPTSVSLLDIKSYAEASLASKKVIILDCCFSGAVNKLYKGEVADQASEAMRKLEGKGTFFLTASTDIQLAEEKEDDEYSLLTKHIINGIRDGKADSNDDGRVSFKELCTYVQEVVPKEGSQRPTEWTLGASGDVTIALTGKPPYGNRKKAVTKKIYELGNKDLLTEDDVATLLKLIKDPELGVAEKEEFPAQKVVESLHLRIDNEGAFARQAILLADSVPRREREAERRARERAEEQSRREEAEAEDAQLKREEQLAAEAAQREYEERLRTEATLRELQEARRKAEQETAKRNKPEEKPGGSNYDPTHYSPQRMAERANEAAKKASGLEQEEQAKRTRLKQLKQEHDARARLDQERFEQAERDRLEKRKQGHEQRPPMLDEVWEAEKLKRDNELSRALVEELSEKGKVAETPIIEQLRANVQEWLAKCPPGFEYRQTQRREKQQAETKEAFYSWLHR